MKSLDALKARGFEPREFTLDGRIHRFDREGKKNAWYIGWLHFSARMGEEIEILVYGDWKTGEKHEWKSHEKIGGEDREAINKRLREAAKAAEEERKERSEQAAENARKSFALGSEEGTTPYLERKKISRLYGAKIMMAAEAPDVVVPMFDEMGVMHGMQRIRHDGQKGFLEGQRVQGLFFTIPGTSPILVCEGYATGVTLHEATGQRVYVAFQASNLIAVATAARRVHMNQPVRICGDDDRYVTKPVTGAPWNPGREAAAKAAEAALGEAIFPDFADPDSKGTDFNDLACEMGLEEVTRQLAPPEGEPATSPKAFLKCLGYDRAHFYYTSSNFREIVAVSPSSHSKHTLMALMPLSYWEQTFQGAKGVDWDRAVDHLMRACQEQGIFDPLTVRGVGAWRGDRGAALLNLGDRIEGKPTRQHFYRAGARIEAPAEEPLSLDEAAKLAELVRRFNFQDQGRSVALLLGWLAVAPFGGALNWRPHMWVTGKASGGKSSLIWKLTKPLFGGWCRSLLGANTTEAAIRQAVNSGSLPVLLDEPDTDDSHSAQRVREIVALARLASFATDAVVAKGTTSGTAVGFSMNCCFMLSSIRVNLQGEADRKRWTLLEMDETRNSIPQWTALEADLEKTLTPEFSTRFLSRTWHLWPSLTASIAAFQTVIGERATPRDAQQLAPLLAGFQLFLTDEPADLEGARALTEGLGLFEQEDTETVSDHEELIEHLMRMHIPYRGGPEKRSVASLVYMHPNHEDFARADEALQECGLRVDDGHLAVAVNHPYLGASLRFTKWTGGWTKSLARVVGAKVGRKAPQLRFSGLKQRCVSIPLPPP